MTTNKKTSTEAGLEMTIEDFGALTEAEFDKEYLRLTKADIEAAQACLDKLRKSDRRGLTLETYRHFHCGYLPKWILTKSRAQYACGLYVKDDGTPKQLPPPSERIIIPTPAMNHFNAVAVDSARKTMDRKFWKQHAGEKELFGDSAALDANLIVVVEGELDAMSIWQCSQGEISAVAILGCDNWKKTLKPKINDLRGKKLLLLFDKDDSGKEAAKKFQSELLAQGCLAVVKFLYDELLIEPIKKKDNRQDFGVKVDCNDVLLKRGDDYLRKILEQTIESAEPDFQQLKPEVEERLRILNDYATQKDANPEITVPTKNNRRADGKPIGEIGGKAEGKDVETIELILRDFVRARDLTRAEWVSIGMILKREGFSLEDFQIWSNDGDARYSAAECKAQWNSFKSADELQGGGYKIGTLIEIAKKHGYKPTRFTTDNSENLSKSAQIRNEADDRAQNPNSHNRAALKKEIAALKAELADIAPKLKQVEKEEADAKAKYLEILHGVECFDYETVKDEKILKAVALIKYHYKDESEYSDFRLKVKNFSKTNKDPEKYNLPLKDFEAIIDDLRGSALKEHFATLSFNPEELGEKKLAAIRRLKTLKFIVDDDFSVERGIVYPDGYEVTDDEGIVNANMQQVCCRPVVITEIVENVEEKIFSVMLAFKENRVWRTLPPVVASTIADKRKISALSDLDLPVTSQNAALLVEYLYQFRYAPEQKEIPKKKIVARGGWYQFGGERYFLDPRIHVADNGTPVEIADSALTRCLKKSGDFDEWKRGYQIIKQSPIARFIVAAACSVPLLYVLGERNFTIHLQGDTRAGKSTALFFAASAIGQEDIVRSFDATKNGLVGTAAAHNDYPLFIDEKQQADNKLADRLSDVVYIIGNGKGRTRLNRNSELMPVVTWRTICITTGETPLHEENVTGGAHTRALNIATKGKILSEKDCGIVRSIAQKNFGFILPAIIEKMKAVGDKKLAEYRDLFNDALMTYYPDVLSEHRRYLSTVAIGDMLLNSVVDSKELIYEIESAEEMIYPIVKNNIPTTAEIDDTAREIDFIKGFIAQNIGSFIKGAENQSKDYGDSIVKPPVIGYISTRPGGFSYFIQNAFNTACRNAGFNPAKVAKDLAAAKFFIPDDKIENGCKSPRLTVQKKIGGVKVRCYRIPNELLSSDTEDDDD